MKIHEAVFFTDNTVVRLETDEGKFYLTNEGDVYDMHPSNVMAEKKKAVETKKLKEAIKKCKFKDTAAVRKWI